MRRAALQPIRAAAARRTQHHRHALNPRSALPRVHYSSPPQLHSIRSARTSDPYPRHAPPDAVLLRLAPPLQASLFFRNAAMALLSSIVAYGAWFAATSARAGTVGSADLASNSPSLKNNALFSVPTQTPLALAPTGADPSPTGAAAPPGSPAATDDPAATADPARRAVVLDNGSLSLGDLPLDVDGSTLAKDAAGGRLVLEMLTPEQATRRLRQNESSFRVDRGPGAVRYDVVQLASNHPIEDDHVERVVGGARGLGAGGGEGWGGGEGLDVLGGV